MESFAPGPQCTLDPDPVSFLRKRTLCLLNLELGPRSRSILNLGAGGNQQHPPPVHLGGWEPGCLQGSPMQDTASTHRGPPIFPESQGVRVAL